MEEAARARLKCVWAELKELSFILTAVVHPLHSIISRKRIIKFVSKVF